MMPELTYDELKAINALPDDATKAAVLLLDSLYMNGDLSVDQHAGIMRGFLSLRARVATLEAVLTDQIELWQMARDTMNIADARMGRVKFMEFHDPIKAARVALEGTR